jgi:hypothetical protein
MKTVREHIGGKPFTRDVPEGCKPKSRWAEEGYVLKPDAVPAAWILMGDNYHEYAVFAADQVVPGETHKPGSKVSARRLEKLFERYQELVPSAADLDQEPGYYSFYHVLGRDEDGNMNVQHVELSGHYDKRSHHFTRGSREKAYERLKELVAIAEGSK